MNRVVWILTAMLLLLPHGAAAAGSDLVDLSKTPWGISPAETAKALGVPAPAAGQPVIITGAKLNGMDAGYLYLFRDNALAAMNIQTAKGADPTALARLVPALAKDLTARYGEPVLRDKECPGDRPGCTYTKWEKNPATMVVLQHDERVTVIYAATAPAPAAKPELTDALKPTIIEAVLAEFPKLPAGTGPPPPEVAVRIQKDAVRVSIIEHAQAVGPAEARGHYGVAGAVKALMAAGINPAERDVAVSCWVYAREGKGLTGKDLVRQYGVARYDPATDGVKWEPSKQ